MRFGVDLTLYSVWVFLDFLYIVVTRWTNQNRLINRFTLRQKLLDLDFFGVNGSSPNLLGKLGGDFVLFFFLLYENFIAPLGVKSAY